MTVRDNTFWRLLCWAILPAFFTPQTARPEATALERRMDVVVKLRIHRTAQATDETAAGVFVGKDRQFAYFITACHAVTETASEKDDRLVPARSVQLQFHNSRLTHAAVVFDQFDAALDLAVVEVPVADLPSGVPEILRNDASLGISIIVIGHPAAGDWSVASGTVQNLNTSTGDIHHFTTTRDLSLAEGHSGGPVFDPQGGFLGMHTGTNPTYGIEAKSIEIVNQLAAWRIPTNNFTSVDPDQIAVMSNSQQGDRDAISRLIDSYINAYNRMDANALWKVWPDAPPATRKAVESYFHSAKSISMKITVLRTDPNGNKATVMAQSSQEFTPRNGTAQRSPESPLTLELEKRNGNWLISIVR